MTFVRTVTCPACSSPVGVSRLVFRPDFRCSHCGAALKPSLLYTRMVVLVGVILGYSLAWEAGIRGPVSRLFCVPFGFILLSIPLAFLVLMLLVRIAPFLARPTLVIRGPIASYLTTLNLSPGPKDDTKNRVE